MSAVAEHHDVHLRYDVPCYAPPGGYQLDPDRHGLDIDPNTLGQAGHIILWQSQPYTIASLTTDVQETEGQIVTACLGDNDLSDFARVLSAFLNPNTVDTVTFDVYDEDGDSTTGVQIHVGRTDKAMPVFLRTVVPDERVDVTVWLDPHGLATLTNGAAVIRMEM